jgi:hypothetical protein
MYDRITPITRYKIAIWRPYYANHVVQNSTSSYETLCRGNTFRLHGDHIRIINTKEPCFHWKFAMYDRITPIMRYKIAILRPNHANYVVRNSIPSYETLCRGTASHLRGDHIRIINTREPYFYKEFAMYDRITPITLYEIAILRPYYANYVVQKRTPSYKTLYRGTTFVL